MGLSGQIPPSMYVGNWTNVGFQNGAWIAQHHQNIIRGTAACAVGYAYLFPFWTTDSGHSIDGLGYWNGTGSAATPLILRPVIYKATSSTNPTPSALVKDPGNLTINATGLISTTFTAIDFDPNTLYWIGSKVEQTASTASGNLCTIDEVVPYNPAANADSLSSFGNAATGHWKPLGLTGLATGAWADPCSSSFSIDNTVITLRFPVVFSRIA